MSLINTNSKEIHCKILYCGAEKVGKKSSLLFIKRKCDPKKIGFTKLAFEKELYCLVLYIGKIFGFQTFFHIYNLTNESQKDNEKLFRGVDGIVFIASLKPKDRQKNLDSFSEMEEILSFQGGDLFKFPLVLQYNKTDLSETLTLKQLRIDLNKYNSKDFESSCLTGFSILEPLKHVCKLSLAQLKQSHF